MTCQVIWSKCKCLYFCTLQIQYYIWGVPNFFPNSIFSVLSSLFYNFVSTHLQKEKENIPLKVAELLQVTLYHRVGARTSYLGSARKNVSSRLNIYGRSARALTQRYITFSIQILTIINQHFCRCS